MWLIVASVTMLLITLLDDNEAKPPIIVAYLRKRNAVLSHCYNSANVIEPREPHTCNNTLVGQRGCFEAKMLGRPWLLTHYYCLCVGFSPNVQNDWNRQKTPCVHKNGEQSNRLWHFSDSLYKTDLQQCSCKKSSSLYCWPCLLFQLKEIFEQTVLVTLFLSMCWKRKDMTSQWIVWILK
jgi:hypothetical protein